MPTQLHMSTLLRMPNMLLMPIPQHHTALTHTTPQLKSNADRQTHRQTFFFYIDIMPTLLLMSPLLLMSTLLLMFTLLRMPTWTNKRSHFIIYI